MTDPRSEVDEGGERVTMLGSCYLTLHTDEDDGHPPGYWKRATCDEYRDAIFAAGGTQSLRVWGTLTDMDGQFGTPVIFTEWGTPERPIAAHARYNIRRHGAELCDDDHAVFVPEDR
jgi:hypothetical protein